MEDRILNLLGLAQRAGYIVSGEDIVAKQLQKQNLKIVFIASDASENTRDKFEKKCYFYKVECNTEFSASELSKALGKPRKVIGLTDAGFYNALEKLMR